MKKVNWREQCYVSVVASSVANLLCPDKRSLVCGSGEELAEDPLTLSAMKSPAYAPDLLLQNCDQMVLCTANHTQTGFSLLKKNVAIISLVVYIYPMFFVIRARLNQPRIALEWHQETDANDFPHITWLIFSYKRVCCECYKLW